MNGLLRAALFLGVPGLLVAQQPHPAPPPADTARIILETRLGGDSPQVATVRLRAGATYLVAARSSVAEISVRHLAHRGTPFAPLDTLRAEPGDSVTGWRTFRVVAREAGEHTVELTNAAVGMTSIRMLFLHRAPGDTMPTNLQHELVFSDHVGPTPIYVTLDSGVTYRILATVDVFIGPRRGVGLPFSAAFQDMGAAGVAFRAPLSGEYRLTSEEDGSVRIYQEAADVAVSTCGRSAGATGCPYRPHTSSRGMLVAIAMIPVIVILDKVFR